MEPLTFGDWLKRKRKALDLTREGLAMRAGCSAAAIRKMEDEERRPSEQMAGRIADIFNIPLEERKAFYRFARGDWHSAPAETFQPQPWQVAQPPARSNLPTPITSFIGREQEIASIRGYLSDEKIRLVTLIGPPGIGKTRLAIESARAVREEFSHDVFFAALAPIDNPDLVAPAILQALGYIEKSDLPAAQRICNGIGSRRILLVLDDCEHLIDAVSSLVSFLLSACSRLTIMATSRESLRVPGEWLVSVPPLDLPGGNVPPDIQSIARLPSLALFAERARAVRADFALTDENLGAVSEICARLDGLPLAIELIAPRIRLVSPQNLLERMNEQFVLSADGMRSIPARQKTLGNAIGWSFRSLPPDEQRLFACLSVFLGGFTVSAAETAFAAMFTARPIPDLLMALSDKSLLQRTTSLQGEVRFNMLVTIRQFALDCLRQLEIDTEAHNRHLACFIEVAEQGARELRKPNQAVWGERLENELDNFRSALEWSVASQQTESALRLLGALGWPWEVRGHYHEMHAWLKRIRQLPGIENHSLLLAEVLNHIGRQSWTQDRPAEARTLLQESLEICQQMGKPGEPGLAGALTWLGLVVMTTEKDIEKARAMFAHSLELNQQWQNEHGIALSTFHLGICEDLARKDEASLSLLGRSLELFHRFGDLFFIARVSIFIGHIFLSQGNYAEARKHFEEQLRLDTAIQFWDGMIDGWQNLGSFYFQQGMEEQAGQCLDNSITLCREHGLNRNDIFYFSGRIALRRNRHDLARESFSHLLEYTQRTGEPVFLGMTLMGMAAVAAGTDQFERAARLNGAAQSLDANNYPETDRAEMERFIQIARRHLGDVEFRKCEEEGRAMSTRQAAAYALENDH